MNGSSSIRVVIIEDQPTISADLQLLIEKHPDFIVLAIAGSVKEALVVLPATTPDLIFLDIMLLDGTGFDILRAFSPIPFKVIFTTAYQEHALHAIKYSALDYLLKPVDDEELAISLEKALGMREVRSQQVSQAEQAFINKALPNKIALPDTSFLHMVNIEDIVYIEAGDGTLFHLVDGRTINVKKPLKDYEELLSGRGFLRTHKSYMVSVRHVNGYHRDGHLLVAGNLKIPVAYRNKPRIESYLIGMK
ncbi:LytR/AlgR family response regulator transcription factor [Chitinophaga arvensicola]|uniref:Two component transcriptional regulator, LytTR family n=1 Tax=Chitinophaga arvensicola TaxID=29529 RepID=A0A1I0PPC6_9BACT|nr:LytTR family DNA-binding domain-containing protein [Chitinophaga arvensicola]SEW16212.1 two component transcriptional regulator, LytTR family [Chitinophaga arvensicola]